MEVTDIKIYPVGEEKLRAFVSVVLDHCFRISDIKIIHGANGRFLSMPSKRRRDGSYRDIAHPLNADMRRYLEDVIFQHYDAMASTRASGNGHTGQERSQADAVPPRTESLAAGSLREADLPDPIQT